MQTGPVVQMTESPLVGMWYSLVQTLYPRVHAYRQRYQGLAPKLNTRPWQMQRLKLCGYKPCLMN
jgi:hypothetical protein